MRNDTDTQSNSSVNLNGHFRFDLDDEQSSRFIKAVLAGEPLPWDITESFITQLNNVLSVAMKSKPSSFAR